MQGIKKARWGRIEREEKETLEPRKKKKGSWRTIAVAVVVVAAEAGGGRQLPRFRGLGGTGPPVQPVGYLESGRNALV